MKKAFIRILCLLLGVNVFTACYGPHYPGPETGMDLETIQKELEALDEAQQLQEAESEAEPETPEQE